MEEGFYIPLFSPSDVTAFHRIKYGRGGVIQPCFHRVTSLRFLEYYIVPQVLELGYDEEKYLNLVFQLYW